MSGQGPRTGAIVITALISLCLLSGLSAAHGVAGYSIEPAATIVQGSPFLVSFGDWRFLNVTIHYWSGLPPVSSMVLFGVFKNSEGQTVGIATGGITLSTGESSKDYALVYNIAPGAYTVFLFVVSVPGNEPLSLTTSALVLL